ncbi:UDP-2,4-diacetamido-2,4,6-trideoxy-beta-L-altropyranose hydrolase [Hymenobacter algoricola]|uniref:UDP-2,4-diacetamido-2,4, 6-trideoxy-beta-L-altropyranose hydrolase n=1 Tax=Hymenobacter algoricola TaxID=486267 RepID=A0ABP7MZQ0_9BACT
MRILFRADGNATIGLGHVIRSLALAEIVHSVGECWMAIQEPSAAVRKLVQHARVKLWELPAQTPTAEADYLRPLLLPTDVVVLDGYSFATSYQQTLAASGCQLAAIDDLRAWPMAVDLIINHSPGITSSMYQVAATTRFCLGPEYSLLRPPFLANFRLPEQPAAIERVLLCFGGADPLQLTRRCLTILLALPALREVGVLTGSANEHADSLQQLVAASTTQRRFYQSASASEMVTLLQQYDAIICPASTILIESLVLGKAALTGYYALNQQPLANYVHQHQQAHSLGSFTALSDAALQEALTRGLQALAHEPRQPYVQQLMPQKLQAEFALLRQG